MGRKEKQPDEAAADRVARAGLDIERKPYLQSEQEGGPQLDPDSAGPADGPGSFGSERSGGQ